LGYDRDNGAGSVATVVQNLKNGVAVQPETSARFGKGLDDFMARAHPSRRTAGGFELGVDDELKQALEQARSKFGGPKDKKDGPA